MKKAEEGQCVRTGADEDAVAAARTRNAFLAVEAARDMLQGKGGQAETKQPRARGRMGRETEEVLSFQTKKK
jgi:hypothetical protein